MQVLRTHMHARCLLIAYNGLLQKMALKLREQEQGFAYNKAKTAAKKNPRAIVRPAEQQPVDESALRGKVVKAALATEREKRDNAKRADQASAIIANLPPNARRTRIR